MFRKANAKVEKILREELSEETKVVIEAQKIARQAAKERKKK